MKRSRGSATLVACLLVLPVAGCYQGSGKTVSHQEPTGNGTYLTVSDTLQIENLVVVSGGQTSKAGSVVLTLVNNGDTADALAEVQVSGAPATVRPVPITVAPSTAVAIGGTSSNQVQVEDLATPAGSYAKVVLKFQRAGVVNADVLVVPPTGFYEPYAPAPAASPTDAASPSS